jgi:hypothetical protein
MVSGSWFTYDHHFNDVKLQMDKRKRCLPSDNNKEINPIMKLYYDVDNVKSVLFGLARTISESY